MYSLVLFLLAAAPLAMAMNFGYYQCEPCRGEECDQEPKEPCLYGKTRDACGRIECMAGPGSRCGGRDHHLGKCGDGMVCKCGKCRGCSIDRLLTSGIVECDYNNPICS